MLRDEKKRIITGSLELDYKEISVYAIVEFIKGNLSDFAVKYSHIEYEDSLTQMLVTLLMQRLPQPSLYYFHPQNIENIYSGQSPTVDIGVRSINESGIKIDSMRYSNDEAFFSIEAKRLDSGIDRRREKEYVVGRFEGEKYRDQGGIERFKKGNHGGTLKYAAMIGYMQSDSFAEWLNKINGWINEQISKSNTTELKWGKKDKLIKQDESGVYAEYKSVHSRINGTDIVLFHLWVNLSSGSR